MRVVALTLWVVYFGSACFTYVPAGSTPGRTGETVRVYLARPQSVELEEVTATNVTRVDGEVATLDDGELVVSAWALFTGSGAEYSGAGRSVRVPTADIERVEQKRFSWIQTGGITALGILAGVLFASASDQLSGGGERRSPPGTGK